MTADRLQGVLGKGCSWRPFSFLVGGYRGQGPLLPQVPDLSVDTVFRRKRYFHNLLDMGSGF